MHRFLTPRLALLTFSHFAIDSYASFLAPLLPLLMVKLDLSLTLVGSLVALSSGAALAQPLFGVLADRMRRPWFIALGPLVAAAFLTMVGLAPSYGVLVVLILLGGIGVAAYHPQAVVYAGALLPRRGLAMSIFVSGGTVGFSVGPLIAVGIVGLFGLEGTWLWGLSGIAVTVLLLIWFARVPAIAPHAGARASLRELRPVARPLGALYVTAACRSAAAFGFTTFLPIYLARKGFAFEMGGVAVAGYLTAGAIGAFVGGWLSDRVGRRSVIVWSFAGAVPLYFAFLFLPHAFGLASLLAGSALLMLGLPVTVVMGQELAPRHASTISSMLMGGAWGIGNLLIGPAGALADVSGLPVAMGGLASMLFIGLGSALLLPDTRDTARLSEMAAASGAGR